MRPSRATPFVMMERAMERRKPATQCCCYCCACPLTRGVYWALGLLMAEAVVQLVLSFLRPPWHWRLTPFIIICFVVQDLTRVAILGLVAMTAVRLRRGRSVIFVLRTLFRGLLWLCSLEVVEMFAALAEDHVICDAPSLDRARDAHEPGVLSPVACEVGSDAVVVMRTVITLGIELYCAWIVHSLMRVLLDSRDAGGQGRKLQRVTSLSQYLPRGCRGPAAASATPAAASGAGAGCSGPPGLEGAVSNCSEVSLDATVVTMGDAIACSPTIAEVNADANADAPASGGPPPVGARVRHARHGFGTVIAHEASGGVRVAFTESGVHTYRPSSVWKLQPLEAEDGAGGGAAISRRSFRGKLSRGLAATKARASPRKIPRGGPDGGGAGEGGTNERSSTRGGRAAAAARGPAKTVPT